jgi:sulfonate transport system permease protein
LPFTTTQIENTSGATALRDGLPDRAFRERSFSFSENGNRRVAKASTNPARHLRRLIAPIALVVLWQTAASLGIIPGSKLSSPAAILEAGWTLIASGVLAKHLAISLARVASGLAIGVAVGSSLAIVAGLSRLGDTAVDPPMQMLRALPYLGMTPLLILWFGIGEAPKIALVAFASTFPVYMTLLGGIRAVDPKLIEAGRVFGLDRRGIITNVVLPSALAPALVGFRYALGAAWLSLVVGEQINADSGIGYLINDARDFLKTDVIIVGLLVYAALGLATDAVVRAIEHKALAWRVAASRGLA